MPRADDVNFNSLLRNQGGAWVLIPFLEIMDRIISKLIFNSWKFMNIWIKIYSSNLHNSVIIRRSVTIFIPPCSGWKSASYGAIVGCLGATSGAQEQENHILSGHRFHRHLAFQCDCPPWWIIQYALRIVIPSLLLLCLFLLIIFCPRYQLILGQTHDEMENGKLATQSCESFRPSSLIDHYPITW